MLSRVANSLFWIARYIERAENAARIIDVTFNLNLLPSLRKNSSDLWYPALEITGMHETYPDDIKKGKDQNFIAYMVFDQTNPSSIFTSIKMARDNALQVRSSLSTETWQTINNFWIELNNLKPNQVIKSSILEFCEWIKNESHLFRGSVISTLLRDDAYFFLRLGTSIERSDNTARLLDVKYHLLLPKSEQVGGALDYYEWNSILRSVSALEAYQKIYKQGITPWNVVELLILNKDMPRSLFMCYNDILMILESLIQNKRRLSLTHIRRETKKLNQMTISKIYQKGLHEFLTDFIDDNIYLSNLIHHDFMSNEIR